MTFEAIEKGTMRTSLIAAFCWMSISTFAVGGDDLDLVRIAEIREAVFKRCDAGEMVISLENPRLPQETSPKPEAEERRFIWKGDAWHDPVRWEWTDGTIVTRMQVGKDGLQAFMLPLQSPRPFGVIDSWALVGRWIPSASLSWGELLKQSDVKLTRSGPPDDLVVLTASIPREHTAAQLIELNLDPRRDYAMTRLRKMLDVDRIPEADRSKLTPADIQRMREYLLEYKILAFQEIDAGDRKVFFPRKGELTQFGVTRAWEVLKVRFLSDPDNLRPEIPDGTVVRDLTGPTGRRYTQGLPDSLQTFPNELYRARTRKRQ